jgi:hypothetical protein
MKKERPAHQCVDYYWLLRLLKRVHQGTDGNSAVCFSAQQTARANQKLSRLIPLSAAQQFLAQRI